MPMFVGQKEINFFNGVTKELVQKIIGQKVIYYSVSLEHTKVNDLYGEAINKTVFTPVEINALVLYLPPEQKNDLFTIDTVYNIEVYWHNYELSERNISPKEGDMLKFGEVIYEVMELTLPQLTFGQVDQKVMTKAVCKVSRKSNFTIQE